MDIPRTLDHIDITLLEALQQQGRIKRNTLAEKTGLSVPAVSERLKKLEEAGVITGYHAVVDQRKLGWDVTAFIVVTVDSSKHYRTFLNRVQGTDEIIECHAITGEGTHLLKLRAQHKKNIEWLKIKGNEIIIVN